MLEWDGAEVVVGGHRFRALLSDEATSDQPVRAIYKTPSMIDTLARHIAEYQPRTIIEIGIQTGGSTALLAALAPEAKVVAIELDPTPVARLDRFIAQTGGRDRIRPYYGVDQGDTETLRRIVGAEFGQTPVEFVVDDASHELDRTRASLEALAPFVPPGGCYAIEDWSWGHVRNTHWGTHIGEDQWPAGEPMTPLVHELVAIVASVTGVFDRIELDYTIIRAWRGVAVLDPTSFSLSDAWVDPAPPHRPDRPLTSD